MVVAVAVSGGMDSLLSLLIMKRQGHDVMAVHGHFLPPNPAWQHVTSGLEAACEKLKVPFYALDLHEAFDEQVIAPFVNDYKAGRTPNPCAMCNPRMKFGLLFDAARELGAEEIATGHYVCLEERGELGRVLVRGADLSKDQSYFLSLVPIDILHKAHFPLAGILKKDVLGLLKEFDLSPPLPSESQEICFVPEDDYQAYLLARENMPGGGTVTLGDGTVVGKHQGLWRHTQGQRRGLRIAWKEALYVLAKDVKNNRLIVGTRDELEADGCVARQVNLMVDPSLWPEEVLVQTRYRQKAKPTRVAREADKLIFRFIEPHVRPTPGQVAAVYTPDGAVLAGGIIE